MTSFPIIASTCVVGKLCMHEPLLAQRKCALLGSSARESLTPLRQCRPSFATLPPTRNLITFVSSSDSSSLSSQAGELTIALDRLPCIGTEETLSKVSCTETVLYSGILNECMGLRVLSIDDLTAALPQMRATAVLSLCQTRGNDKGGRSNGQIQSLLVSPSGPFQRGRVRTLDGSRSDSSPILNTRQMAI